jgi:hypothetical protein
VAKNQGYFYLIVVKKKGKMRAVMVESQGCFGRWWL